MKGLVLVLGVLLSACSPGLRAQQLEDLIPAVEEWLNENVDDDLRKALTDQVDRERVQRFFSDLQKRLAGNSVYDLASLYETGQSLVPVLNQFQETRPYGGWLETHLDYLEVAQQLLRDSAVQPPPTPPTPEKSRQIWSQQLSPRAPPAAASRFIPRLKQIFTAEKLPPELVWLAEVESSFNPRARSPVGATGLFQLMPVTAQSLDLRTAPTDERLDPEKNARAAARYLRRLHERFGDWPLALAAYNAGETRVDKLLKQGGHRAFDDISPQLPAETQLYVPKVAATVARREGRSLQSLKSPEG
jgi:membrane-bound lytic murein transglycosylase D